MRNRYPRFFRFYFLLICFCATSAFGQLSDFDFDITHTNETCTGNGSMTFSVSGTQPGSSMLYSIYLLPNTTTPVSVTSAATFSGLTAGNYQVIATQTLNGNTGTQQENVIITDHVEDLQYSINHTYGECYKTAVLHVNITSGNPISYEVMSGPQTFPAQASNEFVVTQGGTYTIRVFDECGEALVQTYTFIFDPGISLPFSANATTEVVGCNLMAVNQTFETTGVFAYPLQVTYTINIPGSDPITSSFTVESGGANSVTITQNLIVGPNETYSYVVNVVDACGFSYTDEGSVENDPQIPIVTPSGGDCDTTDYTLYFATAGTVISAPDTYGFDLPHELVMGQPNSFPIPDLLPGTYTVLALDFCQQPHEIEFTVEAVEPPGPTVNIQLGCGAGMASVYIRADGGIETIDVISAPAAYPYPLPHNLNYALDAGGALRLANLPAGEYIFHIVNDCGFEWDFPVSLSGLVFEADVDVIQHCGSFDLDLSYVDNSTAGVSFWLQKYNPNTNTWGHPQTGNPYPINTQPNLGNSRPLGDGLTLNLLYTGHFRVISYRVMFSTIESERHCINVLNEFDVLLAPIIEDAYSFSCDNATFDVIIDATGMAPLQYSITQMNNSPYVVNNGTSNIFTGLTPGIYNFQVQDVCGNIANRLFEISEPYSMQIISSGTCEGQPFTLSVPNYEFLDYTWYLDNPGNVLSNSATLEIPAISAADLGTYYVHIFTDNPESCIDITLEFNLDMITPLAQAGTDSSETYCGNPGTLDLSAFLGGNFQTGGVWSENTASGTLSISSWDATSVASGTYVFVYTKSSECGPDDISVHSFTINPAPENPIAFLEQDVCQQGDLHLLSSTVAGATYVWTGPNGFTSSEQNPTILNATSANNGTYTVQAFIGDCPSEISNLEVILSELPDFTLSAECNNNRMLITATSASAETFTYAWSGPNGYSSSVNPADISGNAPGQYSLTVTNQAGCSATFSQNVTATLCQIPKGISFNEDGLNDDFDLSGFGDNLKVKIFNRYGMVVYEMNDYVNQWHGQCKDGNMLPSATYYYYIQNAEGQEKTGWVYLMRNE
ncbi:gliding motility-associated C-terminal domain-containing protein [Flavobacterium sp. MAH-1]|uniref:Gliding motility-associated C-terminal domain-containing protein n=1 Tax=Flavobacterium agri TaxID=2743471 RepID=A0A7Y9C4Z6_9FLAO|nr:gliding motility-associated C-terminal domain-containing protein [Flavobacterium agri]NUY80747.1 gliding motility-associated C-terminal domain-containing protein [Flavobacterium agri]NYA70771.1 gliding motility-associated C-terminal domain-containing protein [Flavobacterium agri]